MSAESPFDRVDRMLADVVDRLADEFPQLFPGVVTRCVQAAASAAKIGSSRAAADLRWIENEARTDLRYIAATLTDHTHVRPRSDTRPAT